MARKRPKPPSIFQLKITLKDVEGPVWRRVQVDATASLKSVHLALNEAMGWNNSHLHEFVFDDRRFSDPEIDDEGVFEDERAVCLDDLVSVGDRFLYEYDFGDGWSHEVRVEKKLPWKDHLAYPVCIGGARACPPEDCGGPGGYEDLLNALAEGDEEHELVRWIGGFYDPEGFDVNRTNRALREPLT